MSKNKLQTIEKVVLSVLQESTIARQDDYVLMYLVCEKMNVMLLDVPFGIAMYNHNAYNMPNWESVTRCRRKIQAAHPELANPKTVKKRNEQQEVYKDYAVS